MVALVAAATASPALAGPNEDTFFEAGYTMCDAHMLQLAYDDDLMNRVMRNAAEKLRRGDGARVAADVERGRQMNRYEARRCPADEVYSAEQILLFAKYWRMDSISETRAKLSGNLVRGDHKNSLEAINDAR
ncbi:hypothetical protein BKE38_14185 [Pseudoroseomonas deserti]|uniref:Lysozyme inhibitor LprI N-terminal domain-containing protein n=1 Tax=Teichococcus deserti TaxID=1817963 RepID=A0A1V2H3I9_9PROT|nr:hypothetical protein BKE38_14185 [Pseudoroseomonas deserti]